MTILIFRWLDLNLVGTVGEVRLTQQTVDLICVTFCRLDISMNRCDHILPQTLIDKITLFLKFRFIRRLVVRLIFFQKLLIGFIGLF